MKIPNYRLFLILTLLFCVLLSIIDAKKSKKSKNPFSPKKNKKKNKPAEPQPAIPHGIYTKNGKCFCPVGASIGAGSENNDDADSGND